MLDFTGYCKVSTGFAAECRVSASRVISLSLGGCRTLGVSLRLRVYLGYMGLRVQGYDFGS